MNPHDLDLLIGLATVGVGVLSGLHWLNQARPRITVANLRPLERLSLEWQRRGAETADRQLFDLGMELSRAIDATKEKAQ